MILCFAREEDREEERFGKALNIHVFARFELLLVLSHSTSSLPPFTPDKTWVR